MSPQTTTPSHAKRAPSKKGAPVSATRRRLYGAVHAGAKTLGWSDEIYRDVLRLRYGVTTAKRLTDAQLIDFIEHMRSQGFGRGADSPQPTANGPSPRTTGGGPLQAKIRALWLACWNLGVVRDRRDGALAHFVERQTGKEALRFLAAPECNAVIEALKKMAARPYDKGGAGIDWDEDPNPRVCVARAQWRRLAAIGAARIGDLAALDAWLQWKVSPHRTSLGHLSAEQLDTATAKLGAWLRGKLKATRDGRS